jgi:DNA-binding winged helix-turn-helix (wHTH) protein
MDGLMLLRLNGRMVDLQSGSVRDDAGYSTTLRPQTAEVLKVLAAKPGTIVSKDELMQAVWGNIAVSDDSLVQCVIEIRKALGDGKHQIVRTLPKRGYVLESKAIHDSRNVVGMFLATHRRGSWIGLAAGLVLVMAAAAIFWPVRVSDGDRSAITTRPFENTSGGSAGEQRDLAARERAKVAALEKDLLAARSEVDTLRTNAHAGNSARVEALLNERASSREFTDMRLAAYRAMHVRPAADTKAAQGQAFEEQRQRAERLAGNLALAWREVERLKAEAVQARGAGETSLTQAKQALDRERQKVGLLERDLAAARQSISALDASAKVTGAARAAATQRRQAAEDALMRVSEALALAHQRAVSLVRERDSAHNERDAAKDEATRISTMLHEALEQEREIAIDLARELAAARKDRDAVKAEVIQVSTTLESERERALGLARELAAARDEIVNLTPTTARLKHAPKASLSDNASRRVTASVPVATRLARQSGSPEVTAAEVRKTPRSGLVDGTSMLPAALLPTQWPLRELE